MPPRSESGQWLLARYRAMRTPMALECAAMHRSILLAAITAAACSTAPTKPTDRNEKPRAPIDLRIETRPAGGTSYDVTLIATPTRGVKALELSLDGHTTMVGDSAAGQRRTVTTRVTLGQLRGREIVGSAAVDMGSHHRRSAVSAQLGQPEPAAALPITIVRMPDGSEVAEVRP